MTPLHHRLLAGWLPALLSLLVLNLFFPAPAHAIDIVIDYRYDTNNFFTSNQPAKDAMQAAANRYSAVITESLSAVTLTGVPLNTDHRIGFTHPSTGVPNFNVSAATSAANDALAPPNCSASSTCFAANEYRGAWSIPANQLIVYPGGRSLAGNTAGEASTGTGLNYTSVFNSGTSHLNRGFRATGGTTYLPVWGGAISFDNDGSTTWHFNHTTSAPNSTTDFYSIALHEIGHVLGLSTNWTEWTRLTSQNQFRGPNTRAAYNADNGTALEGLNRESATDAHFDDGAYDSYIFQNGSPNLGGTVGLSAKQDLLMEPVAHFTGAVRRFELTNTDVAALRDVGWSTIAQITTQPGDYNKDGVVNAADYVVFSKGLAADTYTTWRTNFGEAAPAASFELGSVPEPASASILLLAQFLISAINRPRRT